ncbi:MAG: TetR/AcrR family transcriptional regulator [Bdellovibrionales bacterium]|nr:TetR/AcrR family transcriptional regulator [Bdellovibrionales bacterium]
MVFCKRNRIATESALKGAAARLFSKKGYEGTRTLEIAKEAGVNEALIARYFGGKEGLLLAILKEEDGPDSVVDSGAFKTSADDFPEAMQGLTLREALQVFFKSGEARVAEREEFMRIALSRSLVDEETARVVREKLIDRFRFKLQRGLSGYLKSAGLNADEIEAISMLLAASNHTFHFLCKRVHQMDPAMADLSLSILAQSVEAFLESRSRKVTRSVTTNA